MSVPVTVLNSLFGVQYRYAVVSGGKSNAANGTAAVVAGGIKHKAEAE